MNHYYRMRRTVRTRLLAMGHDATTLDKHQMRDVPDRYPGYEATGPHSGGYAGFSDSLASNGSSSFSSTSAGPVSRLTETDSSRLMTPPLQRTESKAATLSPAHGPYASSSIDRRGHYHRRMEICERRLEQLITHLDEWLQSGFQGSRPMAVRALQDKASGSVGYHMISADCRYLKSAGSICSREKEPLSELACLPKGG